MSGISLTIDGRQVSCRTGTSLLNAAAQNGIVIPTLCHHPQLKPVGACRVCLVEDEKTGRLMASCVTPAAADMAVRTDTEAVRRHRRNIALLMMSAHPESCIVCNKGNRCMLRRVAAELGVGRIGLYPIPNPRPLEQANPFIVRDLSKCILCGKCIRADHELVSVGAIDYTNRGIHTHPSTAHGLPLEHSSCTFCGTCVTLCPTGALSAKGMWTGTPEAEVETVCGFCGVGCRLHLGISGTRVVDVNPVGDPDTVNGATFCVRGHFGHDFLDTARRLTRPRVRREGALTDSSWDEALDAVAGQLSAIRDSHGPESIGFFGSSKCTNSENYLFQKIARACLGTHNIDNGGYLYGRQALSRIDQRGDAGGRFHFFAGALSGLEKAEVVFVMGADPTHSVPAMSYYLKRGGRKGIPLIVADPRPTELQFYSRIHLDLKPGTDLDLVNGISALICREKGGDASFIERFTTGFDDFSGGLAALDMNAVCRRTGLSEDRLRAAARILSGKKIAFVIGNGALRQPDSRQIMDAVLNLALLTGSIGYGGAGIYIPARENNLVGAWDMGTVPDALPGRGRLTDEASRLRWGRAWNCELSDQPGLDLVGMIEAAEAGRLKALYVMGENPLRSLPQKNRVRRALENLDCLVVQDILFTETAQLAHMVLPGAAFSEKDGVFVNMEGRPQRIMAAVPPPGEALSDLYILCRLAARLGASPELCTPERIEAELGRELPMYAADDREAQSVWALETGGSRTIAFTPLAQGREPKADAAYPVTAIIGSSRFHLGSGTRTGLSARISSRDGAGAIEVSAVDARRWNLSEGDGLRLISRAGALDGRAQINRGLAEGLVFVAAGFNGNAATELLELTPLMHPGGAGWNTCRVQVEKKEGKSQ
jgi:predicted molibdopterin-dependent oxidoreductase YjgC